MDRFEVGKGEFMLNGCPFKIYSGAIHYFRVPREYWRDRLSKLKDCGFNTLETYVAWNAHMPRPGRFLTQGMLDLGAFLDLAGELGLHAIVRPGPYICSEWEAGGLPWWLMKSDIRLRCMDRKYLDAVDEYLDLLMPILEPRQATRGGNILMLQVENEYGSYGDDTEYMNHIREALQKRGAEVPLFTSDGDCRWMLTGGNATGTLRTVNFGSDPDRNFAALRAYNADGPLMCGEFWLGWFDHWGEQHHTRAPEDAAAAFERTLDLGSSANVYMFHGGTNFGFMNGANCTREGEYQPTVNSYDDDALLTEWGDITPKYRLFRDVLKRHGASVNENEPAPVSLRSYGKVSLSPVCDVVSWAKAHVTPLRSPCPVSMEEAGQSTGFILYSAFVKGPREEMRLEIDRLGDRACVLADGKFIGVIYRNGKSDISLLIPEEGLQLDLLVENMGRVNYGVFLKEPKGAGAVRLGQMFIFGWETYPLPMEDVADMRTQMPRNGFVPALFEGEFDAGSTPEDTFVRLDSFKKGVVFINGKPLSRYWEIGPQRTCYLPAPFMLAGVNRIQVLELEGCGQAEILLTDKPDLG
ncbi:MAG: beta-galactosidase [Clostridiales bacterium]|nr:beta-galactosidase [Clostridiales bacterium]